MFSAEDFDGDQDAARAASLEVMDRMKGQADCYCSGNSICRPCSRNY